MQELMPAQEVVDHIEASIISQANAKWDRPPQRTYLFLTSNKNLFKNSAIYPSL